MSDYSQTGTDDFSDLLTEDAVSAQAGPLTGSRSRGTSTSGGGTTRRTSRLEKRLGVIQAKLSSEMFQAGAILGMGAPVTGYYVCQESGNFTEAVVALASKRPEWVDALEHIADIGPGITIGRTVLGMGAAFAVDRGRADPEKQFMKFLGVYQAYQAVKGERKIGEESASHYVPPPA